VAELNGENVNPESPENKAEAFYSGAIPRITRSMPVLAALGTLVLAWRVNWLFAAGFALGCGIAYLNFYWLKRVVTALADRVASQHQSEGGRGVFARFLLRYAVLAAAAYAILKVSPRSLYGMLAGLFLPVAAIACEAGYETYVALRRGL
jgi:small-conductance mechanosensitive channel